MSSRVQHYLWTTRWLKAESTLRVESGCRLRQYNDNEADHLARVVRNRNANARLRGRKDFYYQRAANLEDETVIEIINSGDLSPSDELRHQAELAESAIMASLMIKGDRDKFLRKVAGVKGGQFDLNVISSGSDTDVSSTSEAEQVPSGIFVGKKAGRRFKKNGFRSLYDTVTSRSKISERIERALSWILQSRTDRSVKSAIVKTATAMETLLVIGREPTRRALSERSAYLLSDDPKERVQISRAVKDFYSSRGRIVHGESVAEDKEMTRTVEFGDRMVVLIALVLAANADQWSNADDVRRYCDAVRWGEMRSCERPWSVRYLNTALDRSPKI